MLQQDFEYLKNISQETIKKIINAMYRKIK